jgi:hypothetical protein
MNCQEFWSTMPELMEDAEHPHLSGCPACRDRWKVRQELAAGLRAVAAGFHKLEAPPRVEARLLAAFRSHSGVEPIRRQRRWIPVMTWAAAFAAMFALAFFLVRDRQPEAARTSVSRGAERASAESPSEFEGFISLPNAEAVQADEDMDVVHVEVPRSAMLAVGLEAGADRAGEMVQADVMLGSDGVARAVRFLD